jgi:hypothetical protein
MLFSFKMQVMINVIVMCILGITLSRYWLYLLGERIQLAREARSRLLSLSHHSSLKNSFDINTFLTGNQTPTSYVIPTK